jgi:hypothetical protein
MIYSVILSFYFLLVPPAFQGTIEFISSDGIGIEISKPFDVPYYTELVPNSWISKPLQVGQYIKVWNTVEGKAIRIEVEDDK